MKRILQRSTQAGELNILLIPFIFVLLFFFTATGFGLWAFSERQDYKDNSERKVAAAVKIAKEQESIAKDKAHAEADKSPLRSYQGPEQFGSIKLQYPKTWSGYVVDASTSSSQPLDAYFQPGIVPNINAQTSTFALRIQLVDKPYASVINQYASAVTSKALTSAAYSLPQVGSVVGIRYDGLINSSKKQTGSMVVLPIRDKTLQIWTESPNYVADFNNSILPNLSFSP